MVKVRQSQIPEENGKAKFIGKKPMSSRKYTADDFNDEDEDDIGSEGEESESEEPEFKFSRALLYLEDFGITLSIFGIESIEKDMKFVEKPKAHWEYGITINKGVEPSARTPRVDVSVWFQKEDYRDKRFAKLLEALEEQGFIFVRG